MAYLLTQLADHVERYMSTYLFKAIGIQVLADHPSLNASLTDALVKLYFQQGKQHDLAVEGSVLTRFRAKLSHYVAEQGYFPIEFKSPVRELESQNVIPAAYAGRRLAYLLMQPPGYGKTSISKRLFKRADIKVVSGDETISAVATGRLIASSELTEAIRLKFTPMTINQATHHILNSGLTESLVKLYIEQAEEQDFALDAYVPAQYHKRFSELIAACGYTPITLTWHPVGPALSSAHKMLQRANAYFTHLPVQAKNSDANPMGSGLPFKGTKGCVEHVAVEDGDKLTIRGWAVHDTGEMPSVFRVLMNESEMPIVSVTKRMRPDVQRHFDLPHALYGYIVTARTSRQPDIFDLHGRLKVFAGVTPDKLHGPFHFHHARKKVAVNAP
jgi:hypothetical protein